MGGHVLVVENHIPTRLGLCRLLAKAGMDVRSTNSIAGAIGELAECPSLIVLDLALSDGNGVEVLKAIRGTESSARVATVSHFSDSPFPEWISAYRPDALFGKPLDFADFAQWLASSSVPGSSQYQGGEKS